MIEVPVELGSRRYTVRVARGVLDHTARVLDALHGRRLALVTSPVVWKHHGPRVEAHLRALGPVARVIMPDGEPAKTRRTLAAVHDAFVDARLGRDAVVVAFGGGVVGDVAGFAAATYMRGIDLVQLPTTLLAMVDSAIGGKVGINHPRGKNLLGAFHQPRAVLADPDVLASLPVRELRSGSYEILKCAMIDDPGLFQALAQGPGPADEWPGDLMEAAIGAAAGLKASVVGRDEREAGLRRVLNLGHTVGHALEAVTRFRHFTHGEAVGWGLLAAVRLALRRGSVSARSGHAMEEAVERLGPRPSIARIAPADVLSALQRDKKARAGRVPFVLPTAIGSVTIVDDVEPAEVQAVLEDLGAKAKGRPRGRPLPIAE